MTAETGWDDMMLDVVGNTEAHAGTPDDSRGQRCLEFSVVVPVYNSRDSLEELVKRLCNVFRDLGRSFEIVLVDDGSEDDSWQVIEGLVRVGFPIQAIQLMWNHGQHLALKCGLDHCLGLRAITMDDDLQHPPEEIPKLIAVLDADPEIDAVIGAYGSKRHSRIRNAASGLLRFLRGAGGSGYASLQLTSFRLIENGLLRKIRRTIQPRPRIGQLILVLANRVVNARVHHAARPYGRSGYTPSRLFFDALDEIARSSLLTLRVATGMGALCLIGSLALSLTLAIRVPFDANPMSGSMTTTIVLLFLAGIVTLSLGLISYHLRRVSSQQRSRSQYTVRRSLLQSDVEPRH
ncbi:glycosyltransferase [Candidatus Bipolaricaulota bacterium]